MVALTAVPEVGGQHGAVAKYPDVCTHQLFEQQVERTPDAVALVFKERRLTYRELNRRANQVAHFLRKNGVRAETLVGVCLERSPELVIALLGVWKAGGAYVPLDSAYPRERLSFMVGDAAIRVLLTERKCKDLFSSADVTTVCLDGDDSQRIASEDIENLDAAAVSSNLAYVMYTSGSTGQPKGAMIVHEGLVNYLCWAIGAYAVEAGGSVPVHSSIAFDLTITSLYPSLLAGGQVELLAEDIGAQNLLAALRGGKGRNLVKITPAHLDVLTQQLRPEELAGLTKTFVIGGENLPAESLSVWRDLAPDTRLINEYGPTETVVGCCIYEVRPADSRNGPVPIGRPIANTQLYVLDDDLRPTPPGVMGELYIGGAGVARGYLNRPELTRERFLPDPFARRDNARLYKTGDLARLRPDGMLEFLGRVDNQVKVRGYRIELGEIEAALASHAAVQSCALLAREDTPGNKQLVGYVVRREGQQPTVEEIRAFLADRLPDYMVPAYLVFLESLPLTPNGKVDRKALPAPSALGAAPSAMFTAPRNEIERAIAAIWSDLLKRENIGVEADFFDLGGHSLLAVKALAMVRDLLGVDLPPQTLFEYTRLGELAALVAQAKPPQDLHLIAPRNATGPCPVSFAQQQMWLLHHLAPESPAYNVVDVVSLRRSYDPQALRRALKELVSRHQVLRTTFSRAGGELTQIVHPPFEPELVECDFSSESEEESRRDWARVVREQGRRPFDLSRSPLFRITVVHQPAADHRVLVTIHHIISDEWSMELFHKELRELYEAFAGGRPSPLEALPIQYADFAVWQREWLQGEVLQNQIAYWTSELRGASAALALPIDKPRPATPSGRGATETFEVPKELLDGLLSLSRREQATLFMSLEAVFAALLHRYTGQDDILIGTPISARTHTETQRLIGNFLNTVVLRTRFHENLTFRSLLHDVRARALGAYAHADLPFERLVAELSPARDPGRTPLFQVMFILHNRDGVSQVSRVSGNRELGTDTSKFELTLFVSETETGLEGAIEYSSDLFEAASIERLCRSYGRLLEEIVRDPDVNIARVPILADADRRQVLSDWNRTSVTFPDGGACLHELFVRQAARTPDRLALLFGQQTLTYAELDRRSDALASHLVALGVGPDVLVGLFVERSFDMIVGLLGILKAGGAYVPLDPAFPADRLAYMIEDSGMPVLITHRGLEKALRIQPSLVVRLDRDVDEIAKTRADQPVPARANADHLAYVLYTSGSTGMPKGVAIPHSAIVNFLLSMRREPGLSETDTLLAVTTLSFDIAALELYLPLVSGAKVIIASREDVVDPHRLMRLLGDGACTFMQATPATWRALVEADWKGQSRLKALCGGEALPPDLVQSLLPRCAELWNVYGPTETTVWSTVHKVTAADAQPPIGRPIANTQVYVLDAQREPVLPGAIGELYIGGHGLARGYLRRDELTMERFVPSPFAAGARLYRTGDLARWRVDGLLECLGRTDHQVKLRGYRIELGEIEACIARHPVVRQNVVIAREDAPGEKRLVAYVVLNDAAVDLVDQLRSMLRAALPDYMVPAHFVTLDSLPLTPNGKVDRKALPSPLAADLAPRAESYVAPRSELEMSLAVAWQRVLGIQRVGIDDNFFDLGGDSLKVLKLLVEMESTSGIEIDLGAIFKFPTIHALVKGIGSDAAKAASMAVPLQREGAGRPIYCLCGISMYQELATSLGKGQPVLGVYVPEEQVLTRHALKGSKLDISIPRLAQAYYEAIVKVSPSGPYRLAGSSFGGIVALEVASLMRHDGAEVEFVALLDTLSPRGIRRNWVKWLYRRANQLVTGEAGHRLLRELSKIQDRLVAHGWIRGTRDPSRVAEEAYLLQQAAYFAAIGTWKTRRLVTDFKVVLFRASDQGWGPANELDDDYGWHHYLTGPVVVVDVSGDHLGILKSPYVAELGRRVVEHLIVD